MKDTIKKFDIKQESHFGYKRYKFRTNSHGEYFVDSYTKTGRCIKTVHRYIPEAKFASVINKLLEAV